jgi:putative ATPase
MDLFSRASARDRRGQPLAERMRPATLAEFVGQQHLLGPGKLLQRILQNRALPSLILWGPPGTGKTTLARLLATEVGAWLVAMSAVMAGVKDLREAIAEATIRRDQRAIQTVLFVDEIHRFNKAQQDALLPHVEAGTVTLIGATTENPSFEVNAALLSRAKVLVLHPLTDADLRQLIDRALADCERGLGKVRLTVPQDARDLLAREARGDARRALATLEAAAAVAAAAAPESGEAPEEAEGARDPLGPVSELAPRLIDRAIIEESLQRRTLLYDKAGDEHYGVVSAFIKSLRGSDPDAAVYWMARMLEAGEDPLFILRRMVIFASEDVGLADPRALQIAVAALEAFRFVGLPEGTLPMTEAVIFLAMAPKSNTALTAYAAAKAEVIHHGALPVPAHLRNAATPLGREIGWGAGYQYPHDHPDHHVVETYLPDAIRGHRFYEPTHQGAEKAIGERLRGLRGEPRTESRAEARAEARPREGGEPGGAVPPTVRRE